METIAETIAETLPVANQTVTQVIEVVETSEITLLLNQILTTMQDHTALLGYLYSFSLFAVVVCLCYFCYKFFKIFF